MIFEVVIKSSIALLSALTGAGVLFFIKLDHKKLCALISFSAGALLGAAAFTLIPESSHNLSILELVIGVGSGYLLFWFISKYYAHVCPACAASHFDEQTTKRFSEIVLTLLTALSIHSFMDGIALATGDPHIAAHHESVFAAITTHKFPEGLALAALMFSSNYSRSKIIIYVFLVELVTVLGAVTGFFLLTEGISSVIMGMIMAHVAGGFVYLAIHAVLGEMVRNHKNLVITSFVLGVLIIFSVYVILG
jgi:zinc transporter ZupT